MLAGIGLAWASHCLKIQNKSEMQGHDVEESRHLHLQSDACEQPACMWSTEVFVRDEEAEEALGRAIRITREACTHFCTITLLGEVQP